MPIVEIKGLTTDDFRNDDFWIKPLKKVIADVIVSVETLQLTVEDITFSCVYDPTLSSGNKDIIITVEKLFECPEGKPIRTQAICDFVAALISKAAKGLSWNKNRMVEVFVELFDRNQNGYHRIEADSAAEGESV